MRCNALKKKLNALYDNELSYFEKMELENHLRGCLRCRRRYARLQKDMKAVKELLSHLNPLDNFTEKVMKVVPLQQNNDIPFAGTVWRHEGEVFVHHKFANMPRPLDRYLKLASEERLQTSPTGKALLTFHDGSEFWMNKNAEIQMPKIPHRRELKLNHGMIFANISKQIEEFKIFTPGFVVTVKGTQFLCEAAPSGEIVVTVLEGLVELKNKFGKQLISPESYVQANLREAPPKPKPCNVKKSLHWAKDLVNQHLKEVSRLSNGKRKKILKTWNLK